MALPVKYGNCLLGLLVLMVKHRFRGRIVVQKTAGIGMPHFAYKVGGTLHDYTVVCDVLPWPFYYFLFRGRFRRRPVNSP